MRHTRTMKIGLCTFPTEYSIRPDRLAVAAEERGFESLWFAEHSHIPVSRATPWPGGPELPQMYYDVMDPFVAMTAAATVTSTIRVATGIALVIQRDPIQLAKQVASLDVVSAGRVDLGVGGGWNLEEMRNHGVDPDRRWRILREKIEAMKAIWSSPEAEYHGEFVDFDPIFAWPKPTQSPHPPIHVGGAAPGGIRRAVSYGDGWIPILSRGQTDFKGAVAECRQAADEAGRDPGLQISAYSMAADLDTLGRLRDAGVDRAILTIPASSPASALTVLDEAAAVVARLG
ncbi:MAG: LLM class F420-dependent oxidoreductase [Acidimicrobiales bacterium]